MKRHIAIAAALIVALGIQAAAQEQKAPMAPSTLRVQLIVARYQAEKKISSLPYTLTVNTDEKNRYVGRGNLRLGTQVPISTMARQSDAANAPLVPTVQYKDVGTNIDCIATALDDGRFKLDITVEDSSIDTGTGGGANSPHPSFKSFRTSDSLVLRDGQSAQFSTGTDKVSSDVWKVDVTLTVVK
ncbi:MAG TPA: hypothetical protein VL475_15360 [Planctomycetaceae bacterium]|nr:hypothetical protein [Planctomycetaceae bacterium]